MTPFYMTYPLMDFYQKEMAYEEDIENMRQAYSPKVMSILELIKDRCDTLEFEGSRMYDEHPDRQMMEQMVQQIYRDLIRQEEKPKWQDEEERKMLVASGMYPYGGTVASDCNGWLCDMVRVLFWDEMYRRRCRYRRCRGCW